MTRIEEAFVNKKALLAVLTAGDPTLEATKKLMVTMEEKGVDVLCLGIPFSDPIAEGAIIQEANKRALKGGMTTDKIFTMVKEVRLKVSVPIILSTYLNPVVTYGTERFMKRCKECGVDGIVVSDLPFEEKEELKEVCENYGIARISTVVPASSDRIQRIAKEAEGFIYCIPSKEEEKLEEMIISIHRSSNLPCVMGMEVETEEQARLAARSFHGVLIETAIAELVHHHGVDAAEVVGDYVQKMKRAIMQYA